MSAVKSGSNHPPTDHRSLRCVRKRPAQDSINKFCLWLYNHEAETLPDLKDARAEPASSGEDDEMPANIVLPLDSGEEARSSTADLFALQSGTPDAIVQKNAEHKQTLEPRYLSWNSFAGLYRQYVALAGVLGLIISSASVFKETFDKNWAHCLKRRGQTQHGKCDVCGLQRVLAELDEQSRDRTVD